MRVLLAIAVVCTAVLAHADPAPRRFAVVIGANEGDIEDRPLRYAEADAARIGEILRELGGFPADDVQVLANVTASDLRRALGSLGKRVQQLGGDSILFVFYSGHGDAESLHLKGTRLATRELRELVDASRATIRILVVDACRSGGVTRTKGGRPGPAFAIDFDDRLRSKGVAILSSSAEGEDSQESDRLKASFFTHYLASALRGAADDDSDGRITLGEAFGFASQRTIAATTQTAAGPQHPMYRYDLTGREDLVLTYTTAHQPGVGALALGAGTYVIQRRDAGGPMVAEVTVSSGSRVVAVTPGNYFITRRAPDHLLQGTFAVTSGASTAVDVGRMTRIAYAQLIRKGGSELRTTAGVFALAGARGAVGAEQGPGMRIEAGLRVDRAALSFELRLHGSVFSLDPAGGEYVGSRELGGMLDALRVFDRGRWSFAAGLGAGPVWRSITKINNPGDTASSMGAVVGALAQVQRSLGGPIYARVDGGALGYWFGDDASGASGVDLRFAWSLAAGVGAYFR